jgi:outer membrane immunogenic protein
MKKVLMASAALIAVIGGAHAADLPRQTYTARAPVMVHAFNWTGGYVGLYGGYAFGSGNTSGFDGGMAGGTIGYNWQGAGSPWVFGIEADGGWTNFGDSASATAGLLTVTAESEAKATATLRARLGYAFDRSLLFVTGGGAWARNEITLTAAVPGFAVAASDSQNHFGFAVGGGIEHAFAPNWSAKVEYLYLGLGSKTYFGLIDSGDIDAHTVKLGLNYRF